MTEQLKERGPAMTTRLEKDAHERLQKIYYKRLNDGGNHIKGDIISQAINLLYEKEFNSKIDTK